MVAKRHIKLIETSDFRIKSVHVLTSCVVPREKVQLKKNE